MSETPRSNGAGIAGFVLGLLGLLSGWFTFGFLSLLGLVFSAIGMRREPRGLAIAGLVLSLVGSMWILAVVGCLGLLGAGITGGSLVRARELSNRRVCGANIKGIMTSLKIYANDNAEQYPPSLQVFADTRQFMCPSADTPAHDVYSHYLFIPGQSEDSDPKNVVVYEKESNHAGEGGNVALQDGSVSFITPYSEVERLVSETEHRLSIVNDRAVGGVSEGALSETEAIVQADDTMETHSVISQLGDLLITYRTEKDKLPRGSRVQRIAKEAAVALDQWGNEIEYKRSGQGFELRSLGPDGQPKTDDDIVESFN